jgi:hypothetical protein
MLYACLTNAFYSLFWKHNCKMCMITSYTHMPILKMLLRLINFTEIWKCRTQKCLSWHTFPWADYNLLHLWQTNTPLAISVTDFMGLKDITCRNWEKYYKCIKNTWQLKLEHYSSSLCSKIKIFWRNATMFLTCANHNCLLLQQINSWSNLKNKLN